MAISRVYILLYVFAITSIISICSATETEKEFVLTLDHSNFSETVSKHKFIVVEFYAPWYILASVSISISVYIQLIYLIYYYQFIYLFRFDLMNDVLTEVDLNLIMVNLKLKSLHVCRSVYLWLIWLFVNLWGICYVYVCVCVYLQI